MAAYNLDSNNFQINNILNLFYLDIKGLAPEFSNYPKALGFAIAADNIAHSSAENIASQNLAIAYYFNENYRKSIDFLSKQDLRKPYLGYWLGLSYLMVGDGVLGLMYLVDLQDTGIKLPQEVINCINS